MSDQNNAKNDPQAVAPVTAGDLPKQAPSATAGRIRGNVTEEMMKKEYVDPEERQASLATAIFNLQKQAPFLGGVLQCLNISYVHTIPTAAVLFNNDMKRWDMWINPYYFCKKLPKDENRVALLLHELYHITHKHPMRIPFLKITPRKRQLMNIAADMAINQFIPHTIKGCTDCSQRVPGQMQICTNELCPGRWIHVEDFSDTDEKTGKTTQWATKQTMEWYYEKLISKFDDPDDTEDDEGDGDGGDGDQEGEGGGGDQEGDGEGKDKQGKGGKGKDKQGQGQGQGKQPGGGGKGKKSKGGNAGGGAQHKGLPNTADEHIWDGSAEEKDMLDATEDLVKRAMVKQRLSYDELPGFVRELLEEIKTRRAELNYKALINSAIKKHASGHERKHTWTRKSRRFGNMAPGTKIGDLPKLMMYIDTSGSISIEEANEFLDIVDNFLKAGSRKCRLNLFHTNNYYSEEYKLGNRLSRDKIQSGGTDLTQSCEDIWKRKPDLAIFLTDGCYGDVEVEKWMRASDHFPQCLFIISKQGSEKHPLERLGQTIKIPGGRN